MRQHQILFQSRNRDTSIFRLGFLPQSIATLLLFQSRNRDTSIFRSQDTRQLYCLSRKDTSKTPQCFNLVIEILLFSGDQQAYDQQYQLMKVSIS